MKKIGIVLISLITFFISLNIVDAAIYNGVAGTTSTSSGSCSGISNCLFNNKNKNYQVLQLKFVHYSDATKVRQQLGKTVIFATPDTQSYVRSLQRQAQSRGVKWIYDSNITGSGNYKYDRDYLERYFLGANGSASDEVVTDKVMKLFEVSPEKLTWQSDEKIGFHSTGYRIIIEPLLSYIPTGGSKSSLAFATVKEIFAIMGNSGSSSIDATSMYLSVKYDDIGITSVSKPPTGVNSKEKKAKVADPNSGWGMNIINIGGKINANRCYKLIPKSETSLTCKNTNENNDARFYEDYKQIDCDGATPDEKDATEFGKLVNPGDGSCKIYCKEEVNVSLPGNYSRTINLGGYFEWPSSGLNKEDNLHPLNIKGVRTCKMVGCGNTTPTIDKVYGNFNANGSVNYFDEDYGKKIDLVALDSNVSSSVVRNGDTLVATRNVKLTLPDKTYRYVNPKTGKASNSNVNGSIDIGYGNLATSMNSETDKYYNLEITDLKLGANNVFGGQANKSDYICKYKLSPTPPGPCVCPPGTFHEGKDLWCTLSNNGNDKSCIELQETICNDPNATLNQVCDESRYCDPPYQATNLDTCLYAGNSYQSCKNRLCSGPVPTIDPNKPQDPTKFQCPKNTPNHYMDISLCVESYMKKGKSQSESIKLCQNLLCNNGGGGDPSGGGGPVESGIHIIYRPISLVNPFPSRYINGGISGFNTDNISGRYPGYNWNSKILVKNKILNNRGVDNYEVYAKKPLYVIDLDASSMRKIRKYNDNQTRNGGYGDFTLLCDEGSRCLSNEFLRGTIKSSLVGGTCRSGSGSDFYSCLK